MHHRAGRALFSVNDAEEATMSRLLEADRAHGAVPVDRLRDHLLHAHRRAAHELSGMPLPAIHELEHFDHDHGLLTLDHGHADRFAA